jgi:molybdopterin-guanine dinucleotide biosynthesis protein A
MKTLGAVIAGGKSTRFGSDKAVAIVDELPLIDHVIMGLYRHADAIVIAGRDWRDFDAVLDGDYAGQGPLAGLLAALREAQTRGFDAVVTAPCDALPVPDLMPLKGDIAAVIEGHWLFGFWPVSLADMLSHYLASQPDRSMRGWLSICGARTLPSPCLLYNFNTREDIIAYETSLGAAV